MRKKQVNSDAQALSLAHAQAWNQYTARQEIVQKYESALGFFVALDTLVVLVQFEVMKILGNPPLFIYLITLFFLVFLPLGIFIYNALPPEKVWIPWIEPKDLIARDLKNACTYSLEDLFGVMNELKNHTARLRTRLQLLAVLLIIGTTLPFIVWQLYLGEKCTGILEIAVLILLLVIFWFVSQKKPPRDDEFIKKNHNLFEELREKERKKFNLTPP